MAGASGSIAAARGSHAVGESWWMLCLCSKVDAELLWAGETAVVVPVEDEEGRTWDAREVRRLRAEDMAVSAEGVEDKQGGQA